MTLRMLTVATVVGCGLLLTGCVPPADVVVPVETADAQPVFASDEEALAAAVEVYTEYLLVIQERSSSGSDDLSELTKFVTDEQLKRERQAVDESLRNGTTTRGLATFDQVAIQQRWIDGGVENLITYLCLDVSNVVVLNASGQDVTPESRPNRVALEVEFAIAGASSDKIKIARSDVWPNQSYCQQS